MFNVINTIKFPESSGININMMPIIIGDIESIPKYLHGYNDIISKCKISHGEKAYLSINESDLECGQSRIIK